VFLVNCWELVTCGRCLRVRTSLKGEVTSLGNAKGSIKMSMPRVFVYVIATVGANYCLTGSVPWIEEGEVFFGPCKKRMRPEVEPGDYVMGISPAGVGRERRVLLWMQVSETMTFGEAYLRGKRNTFLRAARGHAIHVCPKKGSSFRAGETATYEHIPDAPHANKWRNDIRGKRDVFLVGSREPWVAAASAPVVTQGLVNLLKTGISWSGKATVKNPLTRNARGKHAFLTGRDAQSVINWVPRVSHPVRSSDPAMCSVCMRSCSCDKE
jgi:hypothetical protein